MVRYYPTKEVFLKLKSNNKKINGINNYLISSNKNLKIYSSKGIFQYENNLGLIKLLFEDKINEKIKIGKYELVCESSEIKKENYIIHQLPIDYILKEYKINIYKIKENAQIGLYLEFEENGELSDLWFETKINIGEHGLEDIVTLLEQLN